MLGYNQNSRIGIDFKREDYNSATLNWECSYALRNSITFQLSNYLPQVQDTTGMLANVHIIHYAVIV